MSLSNSAGWDLYREVLQRQVETRKNTICYSQCDTVDKALAQEYDKGEISGIYLTANLLELQIEALDHEIASKNENEIDREDA